MLEIGTILIFLLRTNFHRYYIGNKLERHGIKKTRSTTGKPTCSIPQNMKVLILGNGALNELLGEVNVTALRTFVEDRKDVTALCQSFLPKISNNYKTETEWSVKDVVNWLSTLNLSKNYGDIFSSNEIDGQVLKTLTDIDLLSFGIVFGDRRKILLEIKNLK